VARFPSGQSGPKIGRETGFCGSGGRKISPVTPWRPKKLIKLQKASGFRDFPREKTPKIARPFECRPILSLAQK
jgi:hypothetical protein